MVTSSMSLFVDVKIPQMYWSTSRPSSTACLLQIGHLHDPLSELSFRYDSRSKHYKKHLNLKIHVESPWMDSPEYACIRNLGPANWFVDKWRGTWGSLWLRYAPHCHRSHLEKESTIQYWQSFALFSRLSAPLRATFYEVNLEGLNAKVDDVQVVTRTGETIKQCFSIGVT